MAQPFNIQHFTVAEGLSQGMVTGIVQDHEGFMWFATMGGLNRFDGYQFRQYVHDQEDSTSLRENAITAIFEDSKGRLWVMTENQGIEYFDKKTGIFHHLGTAFNTHKIENLHATIRESRDGHLWLYSRTTVTEMVVPDDFAARPENWRKIGYQMSVFDQREESKPPLTIEIAPLSDGKTLAFIGRMVQQYNATAARWEKHPLQEVLVHTPEGKTTVHAGADGNLWLIHARRLYCWKDGQIRLDAPIEGMPGDLTDYDRFLVRDGNGNLWITIGKSLYRISAASIASKKPVIEKKYNSDYDIHLFLDRQNRLWMGTNGYGFLTLQADAPPIQHFAAGVSPTLMNQYGTDSIIYRVGFSLYMLNRHGEPVGLSEALRHPLTYAYCQTPAGTTFIRSSSTVSATLKIFPSGAALPAKTLPLTETFAYSEPLFADAQGNAWMTFNSGKLGCVWAGTDTLQYYSFRFFWDSTRHDLVSKHMYQSRNGSLWLCLSHGLVEVRYTSNREVVFKFWNNDNAKGLSSSSILCALDDPAQPDRYLWVGTSGDGLNKMDKRTGECVRYTKANGLPDNVIYGVLPDEFGNLWISTNMGLSRFTPASNAFHNYTKADGLQENEFNTATFFRHPDGRMFFGGVNGISAFHPRDMQVDTSFAPVVLTGLSVNNTPVDTRDSSGILPLPIEYTRQIDLPHDQNFLTVSFAALNFRQMGKMAYSYKMEGVDANWVFAGTRTEVSYPNLPPGTYTLYVANINEAGVRNPHPAVITFHISPPWWRSGLAGLVYALLIGGIGWQIYRFQIRRVKLQNELIFKEKEARQMQQVDELKTRFFTNITHEFRTPLTLILEPVRQLLHSDQNTRDNPMLLLVQNNSARLLTLVNQLLDVSKLEDGQMRLHLHEGDLLPVVRQIVNLFEPQAGQKRIHLQWNTALTVLQGSADIQVLEKVTYNLLSNSLKFTPEGGMVRVSISASGNTWQLMVEDTGIGIPAAALPHIFDRFYQVDGSHTRRGEGTGIGLALVKELVELSEGTIVVNSTEGKGTAFTITLPLHPTSQEQAVPTEEIALSAYAQPTEIPAAQVPTPQIPLSEDESTTVLVVDDNADIRQFLRMTLLANGYQVLEAVNGVKGLETARATLPDLIVSDVMMPEMDGLEFTRLLKTDPLTSHIPVMLLTAKGQLESKLEGYRLGADAYLHKPFHTEELLVRLKQLLESRRLLQQKYQHQTLPSAQTDASPTEPVASLSPLDQQFLERIRAYIASNLAQENLTIEALVDELAMSRAQLYRKVTALTGLSPARLIRDSRLDHAHYLLRTRPDLRVGEVMDQVGMSSEHHFRTLFRERFGVSPQEAKG